MTFGVLTLGLTLAVICVDAIQSTSRLCFGLIEVPRDRLFAILLYRLVQCNPSRTHALHANGIVKFALTASKGVQWQRSDFASHIQLSET